MHVLSLLREANGVRKHFDADVRATVKVKIVHGFWRRDDERGIAMLVCGVVFHGFYCIY